MDKTIETAVKTCNACQVHTLPNKAPIYPRENITSPCVRIYIDFADPIFGKMFLIVCDSSLK